MTHVETSFKEALSLLQQIHDAAPHLRLGQVITLASGDRHYPGDSQEVCAFSTPDVYMVAGLVSLLKELQDEESK